MQIEQILPDWNVVGFIDAGSFGRVYRVQKELTGSVVTSAVKVIEVPPNRDEISILMEDGFDSVAIFDRYEEEVHSIANEIALMGQLKGHPNIVHIEDFGMSEHEDGSGWTICLRMELLTSLVTHIRESGALSHDEVLRLGIDICRALEACERLDIVHRDIKPSNIFIGRDGSYKLGDFGIAEHLDSNVRRKAMPQTGTSAYMAPEVFYGKPCDQTADIYSLGMVLYRLLDWANQSSYVLLGSATARANFWKAEGESELRRLDGAKLQVPADARGKIGAVILKAVSPLPSQRYQGAQEFRAALEECENQVEDEPVTSREERGEANLAKGISRYEAGDYPKAIELLEKAYAEGYAQAEAYLGRCYLVGNGVVRETRRGFDMLLRAAQSGDSTAAIDVATCFRDGVGVERNHSEAFKWFDHAGKQGNLRGVFGVADCYESGLGVSQDRQRALELYGEVARKDSGDLGAMARTHVSSLQKQIQKNSTKGFRGFVARLLGIVPAGPDDRADGVAKEVGTHARTDEDVVVTRVDSIQTVLWDDRSASPAILSIVWKAGGRTFDLRDEGRAITIGRYGCDITLHTDNYHIGRNHAKFAFDAGRVYLVDNNSSNGTYLNGECLAANQWYPIKPGDSFSLADELFSVVEPIVRE